MNRSTPTGFRDVLPDEAAERERITRSVQDLFARVGFRPIETPTLEALDVVNAGAHLPASPFRFFDSQGDLLAMRPDVTVQVARMCSTRLAATDQSLRLRYTQRVFRETEGAAQVAPREMTQIGVEALGESGCQTDAELVSLLLQALALAGVVNVTLALATVAPLRALLERSGGGEAWKQAVLAACHASDFVALADLTDVAACTEADASGVAPAYAQAIYGLVHVRGGDDAIEAARRITEPLGCADGLDELASVLAGVRAACPDAHLLVDFSAMSSFDYYTGIVFEAFSPYLGSSLGSGGRYDHMLAAFGAERAAAGFAFSLEQAMAAAQAEGCADGAERPMRIAVPKGALNKDAIESLQAVGLDTAGLEDPGRQLIIRTPSADYIIVRPSDAPAFVASGAADCGICGRDSLLESDAQVVQLADLKFGGCRFVVAELAGTDAAIQERYRRLGSMRVATKYPNITRAHFKRAGIQADIVRLNGNIELAPMTGLAERIVDITATGTTLRENDLVIVDEVLASTARFFANPARLRTDARIVELADALAQHAQSAEYEPIAGGTQ